MAGRFIADLHGRDLRDEDFLRLWSGADKNQLQLVLEMSRRKPDPIVIAAEARTEEGAVLHMEIMLTPLAGPSGEIDRMMGFYQPTSPVVALAGQSVRLLTLKSVRTIGAQGAALPHLRLATLDGRLIA